MFKSSGLAKMFAGRRKFFRRPHAARGPHVRHLCFRVLVNAADLGLLGTLDTVGLVFCRAQVHCSSPSPSVEKYSRPQLCTKKETRMYVLNFLRLHLLLPAGIDNQIVENDAIKTQIVKVIKILHVTQKFLLACLHKITKTFRILQ